MMQRYIVFLNDRTVTISTDFNSESGSKEMMLDFKGKSSIVNAYKQFYENQEIKNLVVHAGNNFADACGTFNSMFSPISAAGGIVRNSNNEYLFIKRLGIWDLPKGKLYPAERIEDGALREVMEETGLSNLTITAKLPSTYHIYTDRKGKEILKETFWFEMMGSKDEKLIPQLEEDITEARWFEINELTIPLQNTYSSLKNLLESYFLR